MGVSLRPSTFSAGGSLVDDADLTLTKARFIMTDYGGKSDSGEVCVFQAMLAEDDGIEHEQLWSIGTGFVPSETGDEATNGKELVPVGDKTAPNGSSNFAMLITSMVNAGLPEDLLDSGDISALEGLKGHFNRVPAPKRSNLPQRKQGEKKYEATILLLSTVISLPGETKKAAAKGGAKPALVKGATAGAAKPSATATVAPSDDLSGVVSEHLMGIFLENDLTELKKVEIVTRLFKAIPKDDPLKKDIVAWAGKKENLETLEGFTFDGTLLKMG